MDSALNSENSFTSGEIGDALAALDRKDYATAKRLFEALGRKDAAESIEKALAALDRKDYATAQGLFEALAPPKPAPMASDARSKAQSEPIISPLEAIPRVDPAYRRPAPLEAKRRGLKPILIGTLVVLIAAFGASAIHGSRLDRTFSATKSQAAAGLASTVDLIKARFKAVTGQKQREEERSAMRDLGAALTQATIRLDQIEHDYDARLDRLGERIDQESSAKPADAAAMAARLEELEKKTAAPDPRASEFADVVARLNKLEKRVAAAAAPASELADIATRLNKLEKKAAAPAASPAKPFPAVPPAQSALIARAEPHASNEMARPDNPGPLLRDYSVEDVQDGVAVVDTRNGPQEVAPGDFIPGAGRVLRIERRGEDWFVLTSLGVIASGPSSR